VLDLTCSYDLSQNTLVLTKRSVGADLSAYANPTTYPDEFVHFHYRPFSSITLKDGEPLFFFALLEQ